MKKKKKKTLNYSYLKSQDLHRRLPRRISTPLFRNSDSELLLYQKEGNSQDCFETVYVQLGTLIHILETSLINLIGNQAMGLRS